MTPPFGLDLAGLVAHLVGVFADEADRAVSAPQRLAGIMDQHRNAGCRRLLDQRVHAVGEELADQQHARVTADRLLQKTRIVAGHVGRVGDRDVGVFEAEGLGTVVEALLHRGEERPGQGAADRDDRSVVAGERGRWREARDAGCEKAGANGCRRDAAQRIRMTCACCLPPFCQVSRRRWTGANCLPPLGVSRSLWALTKHRIGDRVNNYSS